MRVRISSQGRKSQLSALRRPRIQLSGNEIDREKRRGENPERADLLRDGGLIAAQGDAEGSDAESDEKSEKHLGDDVVCAQEFLELIRIEIREHFIPNDEGRNVGLIGKFLHFLVGSTIQADIDLRKLVAVFSEVVFRINAPGTPFAAEKSDVGRHGGN